MNTLLAAERRVLTITATPDELRLLADRAEDFGATLKLSDSTTLPTTIAETSTGTDVLLSLGGDYVHDPLDAKVQLHEEIRVYYVVDGYVAVYSGQDGNRDLTEARGETVWEALVNLNKVAKKPDRGPDYPPALGLRCPRCGRTGGVAEGVTSYPPPLKKYVCGACDCEFLMEGR